MSTTLRVVLIIGSVLSFLLCIKKIKQSKLQITTSVIWMIGSIILVFMSIFSNAVDWISDRLGFIAPVNFVFFTIIAFLLIEVFISNIKISVLDNKIKELNHYIALNKNNKEE